LFQRAQNKPCGTGGVSTVYHAGCAVCVSAEKDMLHLIDASKVQLEVIHFGEQPQRIQEAEQAGVKSVPALVTHAGVLHINFGASMEQVKQLVSA
jgi:glutaredoxin 3